MSEEEAGLSTESDVSPGMEFFKLASQFGVDELLPEWEISVVESGNPDKWEHYHPRAATAEEAREKAKELAKGRTESFNDPVIHEILLGPYAPRTEHEDIINEVLSNV